MTFPSLEAYLTFWKAHPALVGRWDRFAEGAFTYDLVGEPPELRSSVLEEAVLADMGEQLLSGVVHDAVVGLQHPAQLLCAPRGLQDEVPPLYPRERIAHWEATVPGLHATLVPDVNHYTILLGAGADRVARRIQDL